MTTTETTDTEPTNEPGPDHWRAHQILDSVALPGASDADRIAVAQVYATLELAAAFRSLDV